MRLSPNNKTTIRFDRLLAAFPEERARILSYADRAAALHSECGCSMGAKFFLVSLFLDIIYVAVFGAADLSLVWKFSVGIIFVFASTLIGKLTGKLVARVRLALLYRSLQTRYPVLGD